MLEHTEQVNILMGSIFVTLKEPDLLVECHYHLKHIVNIRVTLNIMHSMDFYLKDLLEKNMATHSSILVLEFHGQKSLMGYSPWDHSQKD